MDCDIFISYIEEDGAVARALASELRSLGHTTWTYEENGVAGISYLTQVHRAIESCRAFVLLASQKAVKAHQVIREVEQAHEREKTIVAVRLGLTHQQFVASNAILRMASGTAVTIAAEAEHLAEVARRITSTLSVVASSARGAAPNSAAAPAGSSVGKPSQRRKRWPPKSLWIGVGVQIAWGAYLTIASLIEPPVDEFIPKSLSLTLAIGIAVTAIVMGRYCAQLRRSSDAKSETYLASVRRLQIVSLICPIAMSALMWPTMKSEDMPLGEMFGIALLLVLPCVLSVGLVWNGLGHFTKADDEAAPR